MATVTLTYVIHNVPPGKCSSVFTASGPLGAIDPITTDVDVPIDHSLPVTVDPPHVVVSS